MAGTLQSATVLALTGYALEAYRATLLFTQWPFTPMVPAGQWVVAAPYVSIMVPRGFPIIQAAFPIPSVVCT